MAACYLELGFFDDIIYYLLTLYDSTLFLVKKEYQCQLMTTYWCRKSYPLMKKLMILSYVFSGELRISSNKDVFEFGKYFAFSELFIQIISQYFYLQANNTIFNYEDPKSNLNILCLASGKRLSIECSSKSTDVLKLFIHARNGYSSTD